MPDLAIETQSLRKHFDRTVAVADLSLSIRRGEVFGFLGPNGAGKTTSLKLLLGLIEPSGGDGTVLGAPLGTRTARAKIGFLPEHFRFHDCLTGRELLRIHGRLFGMRGAALEARIDALLARVALTDAADRRLQTYSKGMLQRAGLAQALVNSPELVFLDEPTSGLDPLGRVLVRSIIEELRALGTTVFLNSHLLGEVEATCDRVAFVKQGRVIEELALADAPRGLAVELRIGVAEPAALAGLAAFGDLDDLDALTRAGERDRVAAACEGGTASAAREVVASSATQIVRLRLASEGALPELAPWLVARGIALYELRVRRKSLEESFIEIMGEDQRPG
jgi:ABC-2 type transport system ATP-binding protein